MPEPPIVSVLIPCYNAERWIREALNSVFRQGIRELEVIVADDGSTDRGPEIIQAEFPSVQLLRLAKRSGPSRARNEAFRRCSGRFIQYLDADDWLEPGKISAQMEVLERSKADLVYGDWTRVRQLAGGREIIELYQRRMKSRLETELLGGFWCPIMVYLFRREIVAAAGPWREDFPVIEDVRFVLDCAMKGAKFHYSPGMTGYYRVHYSGSLSRSNPPVFAKTCYRNAAEIQERWQRDGGLDPEQRRALVKAYDFAARSGYFSGGTGTFEAAYRQLRELEPGYLPRKPARLAAAARLLGFRNALRLSRWWHTLTGSWQT